MQFTTFFLIGLHDRYGYQFTFYALGDSDFEIPAKYTKGKNKISIEIKYVGSPQKKEVNEFYYWVYSYKN
jgi:hypothetical protein